MPKHFVQWQIGENVAKDQEERLGIAAQHQITEQVDRSGRAEECILLEVANLELELFLHLSNESIQLFGRLEEANQ